MTNRELLKQAQDALEYASDETKPENLHGCDCLICKTILALRDRLAQSEQEPKAWYDKYGMITHDPFEGVTSLYTTPQQRQWVGLTDDELEKVFPAIATYHEANKTLYRSIARAIEAKLRENNGG
jgi:hypothetical protein